MSIFWQDVRYGARRLRTHPGHTAIVALTLALGIGATTSIYSFLSGVVLRPLPYPEPDRLVQLCEVHPDRADDWCGGSPANLRDWRRESRTVASMGLARTWSFGLKGEDGKFRNIRGGVATAGLFETLGTSAALGRLFEEADHQPGKDHVVLLSHALWQSRFGGDPAIVGRSLNLDEETYFVAGVLPRGFEVPYLQDIDLWIPLWSDRVGWRHWRGLRPYGRLAPGRTLEEARAEFANLAAGLAEQYPETNAGWSVRVDRVQDALVAPVRPALLLLMGAAGLVLLIACANTAHLLLASATYRRKELAIRAALGAGRGRLVRSLLTEGLLLALLGGGAGVLLATWLVKLFVSLAPAGFPRLEEVGVDGQVLLFSLLLSVATSLVFGLLPARHASRVNPDGVLKEGRYGTASASTKRARAALAVAEVSIALVLLVGAGLLIRSFVNLTGWKPGFETGHIATFSLFPPIGKYHESAQLAALYRRINERITALPGVVSAGEVSAGPLFGGGDGVSEFHVEGRPVPADGAYPTAAWFDCGPNYFRTMGIELKRGRYFTAADGPAAPAVGIINETMARRYWPGEDPIGARIDLKLHERTLEIVGIVRDVPHFDPREPVEPEVYWPLEQAMRGATFYAVRTAVEPAAVIPAIRATVEEIEPEAGLSAVQGLEERIGRQLIQPRFHTLLLGIFAGIALAVAMLGIYGIISSSVARRTREFGIRLALGARPAMVLRLVLGNGLLLALLGVVLGALGSLALTGFLRSLLVGVTPTDPATFVAVAGTILAVSAAACWFPAWRATRVDPARALRHD